MVSNLGLASHLAIVDDLKSQLAQKEAEGVVRDCRIVLLEKCLKFLLRDLEIRNLADSVSQGIYSHASIALQTSVGVVDAPMFPEPTMVSSELFSSLLGDFRAVVGKLDDSYQFGRRVDTECRWENGQYNCQCCEEDREGLNKEYREEDARMKEFMASLKRWEDIDV